MTGHPDLMRGGDGQQEIKILKNERRKLLFADFCFEDVPTAAGRFNSGHAHQGESLTSSLMNDTRGG